MDDLTKYLEQNPGSVVFARFATRLADEGRLQEAIDVLRRGTRANPFYATGHAVLGEMLLRSEADERADESIRTALALDPQLPGDLVRLGRHLGGDSPEEALVCLDKARRYSPDNPEIRELADQLRQKMEPNLDLQLSDRTEQALRDITDGPDAVAEPARYESEEDMLAALASEPTEQALPDAPPVPEDAAVDVRVPDIPDIGEEYALADEHEAATIAMDETAAGEAGAETEHDVAEVTAAADTHDAEITETTDIAEAAGMDDAAGMDAITGDDGGSGEATAATEPAMPDESFDVADEQVAAAPDAMPGVPPEEIPGPLESREEPAVPVSDDGNTVIGTVSDEQATVPGADDERGRTDENPSADASGTAPVAGGEKPVDAGNDLTEDFLAYAQMIEAESVNEESSTYDKLISEPYGEPDNGESKGDAGTAAPFDLDDEWMNAIAGRPDAGGEPEQSTKASDDELTQELMDYVKLFQENTGDASGTDESGNTVEIRIDENDLNAPSEPAFKDESSEAVLSDAERQALERGEIYEGDDDTVDVPPPGIAGEPSDEAGELGDLASIAGELSLEELEELGKTAPGEPADEALLREADREFDAVDMTAVDQFATRAEPDAGAGVTAASFETAGDHPEGPDDGGTAANNVSAVHDNDGVSEEPIEELSIDDLIHDYVISLNDETAFKQHDSGARNNAETAVVSGADEFPSVAPSTPAERRHTPHVHDGDVEDNEEITATIAEIYVAQGLLRKAIGMYHKLLVRDPSNEAIRSRLTGLQQQLDRQSETS